MASKHARASESGADLQHCGLQSDTIQGCTTTNTRPVHHVDCMPTSQLSTITRLLLGDSGNLMQDIFLMFSRCSSLTGSATSSCKSNVRRDGTIYHSTQHIIGQSTIKSIIRKEENNDKFQLNCKEVGLCY